MLGKTSKSIPSDRKILKKIYNDYFKIYKDKETEREAKIYVPIDVRRVARELHTEGDIVFGRLYYFIGPKYHYKKDDGMEVFLFMWATENEHHLIHFPMLAAVLAGLDEEYRWNFWAIGIAISSLTVSTVSIIMSIHR